MYTILRQHLKIVLNVYDSKTASGKARPPGQQGSRLPGCQTARPACLAKILIRLRYVLNKM